jgi:hypothetical protein
MPFVWVLFYIYMECDENSLREIREWVRGWGGTIFASVNMQGNAGLSLRNS